MWQNSYDEKNALYLIPTPIGNLDDMTFRAVETLKKVDVVFSEDTRVTLNLFNHFEIKKKLIPLHDHNEDTVKEKVLEYLKNGKNVGLVSDRGTPIISDPGYKTVRYVTELGFKVVALPGANAFVPALIVSSLAPKPFIFYGFLNNKSSVMKKELESLKDNKYTMIFYESPHRIFDTLNIMLEVFGDREFSLTREISKKYESIYRGKIKEFLDTNNDIKGELVIVVEGNHSIDDYNDLSLIDHVDIYIKNGLSVMDSIKKVARERNLSKNEVYHAYHER